MLLDCEPNMTCFNGRFRLNWFMCGRPKCLRFRVRIDIDLILEWVVLIGLFFEWAEKCFVFVWGVELCLI